jgi:hypothetical protein
MGLNGITNNGSFSTQLNTQSNIYPGGQEYIASLKTSLSGSATISTPINSCNITFGSYVINFDFFNDFFQKSPLNYNLFNKINTGAGYISSINDSFIKIIEDLKCCELAEMYNSSILPLFLWVIGDSGDKVNHPKQFDNSRKTSGLLPIMIDVASGLIQANEVTKNLICIIRPVPGNPWLKAGGVDFMKPVYNFISEVDYISNTILNGDYLNILIDPLKEVDHKLKHCVGKNRDELVVSDVVSNINNDIRLRAAIIESNRTILANSTTSNDDSIEKLKNNISAIEEDIFLKFDRLLINSRLYDKLVNNLANYTNQYIKTSLIYEDLNNIASPTTDQKKVIENTRSNMEDLRTQIDRTNHAIVVNQDTSKKLQIDFDNSNDELESAKKSLALVEAAKLNETKIENQKNINQYRDCLLMTDVLIGDKLDNSCGCLFSVFNLFIPIPEFVTISNSNDASDKLFGRLPFSESSNYKNNKYILINRTNLDTKFPGHPTLTWDAGFRTTPIVGLANDYKFQNGTTAGEYFNEIDNADTLTKAILLGDSILQKSKYSTQLAISVDTELALFVSALVQQLKSKKIEYLTRLRSAGWEQLTLLKNNIYIIDDLLTLQDPQYWIDNTDKFEEIGIPFPAQFKNLFDTGESHKSDIEAWQKLLKFNTRSVTLLSKDNPPCDCSIICTLIQYVVNLIIDAIKVIFDRIVMMLVNALLTKDMIYIIRFIKAKLQCAADILAISENLNEIKNRTNSLIDSLQGYLNYANDPVFCSNLDETKSSGTTSTIPIGPKTNTEIIKSITDYNITANNFAASNGKVPDTQVNPPINPYPNNSGEVTPIDTNSTNANHFVINNVIPGEQYEFRNIPTLKFDCSTIIDTNNLPTFDIITGTIPNTWSIYFSFQVDETRLNNLENQILSESIPAHDNAIKSIMVEQLKIPLDSISLPYDNLDISGIMASVAAANTNITAQYNKKAKECTPTEVISDTRVANCGYSSLKLVSAELVNSTINSKYVTFVSDLNGLDIRLIDLGTETPKYNIPIKVKVQKIFDLNPDIYVVNDYKYDEVSVILLIDLLPAGSNTMDNYINKPTYDPNVLFNRYPYIEIGYRDFEDIYHIPQLPDTKLNYLDSDTILELCEKALKKHADSIKDLLSQYAPTAEQIAAREANAVQNWQNNTCSFPIDTKQTLDNNAAVINDIITPLLKGFTTQLQDKADWEIARTQNTDTSLYNSLVNTTTKTTTYGLPLLELNSEKTIVVQIVETSSKDASGNTIYQPMINISNFTFLTNVLNIQDANNIPMPIKANTLYFMSITFDGLKYTFTLINENKVKAELIKLSNGTILFPSRFGRVTNPVLKNQTFCGTIFDLGITNSVINPDVYFKFSMMNFRPKTEIFIDFELNISNNFYSDSELPIQDFKNLTLTQEVKSWIENNYVRDHQTTSIPYYIFNKNIAATSMTNNLTVINNSYKSAIKECFITNFFCQDSLKRATFTMSFWIKPIASNVVQTPSRLALISDTINFNNLYYNQEDSKLVFELANKKQVIKHSMILNIDTWYNIIIEYDKFLNKLTLFATDENQTSVNMLWSNTLENEFIFSFVSMLSEFDFETKQFSYFFPVLLGNFIMDSKILPVTNLNEQYLMQKLCFKGL